MLIVKTLLVYNYNREMLAANSYIIALVEYVVYASMAECRASNG